MSKNKKLEINQEKEHIKALQDQLARALADYDNFRKRTEREKFQLTQVIKSQLVATLLPAIDMLIETQKHLSDVGLSMAIQEIGKSLKEEGIVEIETKKGGKFNELLHEAVDTVKDKEKANGEIVEEVFKGWRVVDGPVIRHAKVRVVKNEENTFNNKEK